ncbi:MAG TPA: IS110 family transposase [Chitinophagaceae bacterium]|jgi:transposase|nr:IS110 family transposase [Chitinophagaceae bacterium]
MKKSYIIGVDVSKLKLDVHCYGQYETFIVSNDIKGFKTFLKWMKRQVTKEIKEVMVVMEYTGIYTYSLEQFLQQQGIAYVKRPALDIKRSVGMRRGKTDKTDARMISQYGWYRREELKPMKPVSDNQQQLQQLMSHRDKLVADKASYQARLKELRGQLGNKLSLRIVESTEYVMQVLEVEIRGVKKAIEELIASDDELQANYDLTTSVQGIGFVTAVQMLIVTENFTRFNGPRKFACYSGVAPFEHESGSSIRGKTKTSQLANKKIKALLTLAAICAVRHDPQLKVKFEQKVQEGKAKMSALNMIRFKLIERIFAVIKRQTPYILSNAA